MPRKFQLIPKFWHVRCYTTGLTYGSERILSSFWGFECRFSISTHGREAMSKRIVIVAMAALALVAAALPFFGLKAGAAEQAWDLLGKKQTKGRLPVAAPQPEQPRMALS
jgi:hypothetical protein